MTNVEEIQVINNIKDDFLAMLSHEMRTPLNGIMGMLQLALHSHSRDSIREYLTVALESSKHLHLLLGDISEIASNNAAFLQPKMESFELDSAISPIIASFANQMRSKGLELTCQVDHRLPKRFLGDAGRIRQIIFSLLTNAVKQTKHGEINILASPLAEHDPLKRHGLHILLKAVDAGKAEKQNAPARQTDAGAQSGIANMGLRLPIVKHLVRSLGGELVLSLQQDRHNEVQVLLPLQVWQKAEQELAAGERKEEVDAQLEAAKILVVEDEPINLKTMLLSLQLLGCKVVGADSAYKGLALLRREKFDIVLMDIQMPGLDGLEATRLIRGDNSGAMDSRIPIVAITAHAMQGDKERILKAGVDEYLAKPVYLEQLRSVLSKILKRPLELKTQ